jgi:hypothetical protein
MGEGEGMKNTPNPGSDEAIKQGCTCPREDNHCGKGCYDDGELFWMDQTCPIHGATFGILHDKEPFKEEE